MFDWFLAIVTFLGLLLSLASAGQMGIVKAAGPVFILTLVLLVFFRKQVALFVRCLAAGVTVYVLSRAFGLRHTVGLLAVPLLCVLAFYVMFRPFMRGRK